MAMERRNRSEDVVEAAIELARDGWSSLSVRRLAEQLGVSRQVVYTHFGGVEGLLDAMHRHGAHALAADVQAHGQQPGSDDHLVAVATAYIAAARERPALFQLMFQRPVPGFSPSEASMAATQAAYRHIVHVAGMWLARRGARPAPTAEEAWEDLEANHLARILWSSTHGHVVLEMVGHATVEHTDLHVPLLVRSVLAGWT